MSGFVKIHRKIRQWEWYSDTPVRSVFLHLLLCANYERGTWKGITIEPGQVPTGRKQIARELGLTEQQVRRSLNTLANSQQITIQTTNRFSIVTIAQWETYQSVNEKQPARAPTNNQPERRQTTTLKEGKKKEDKKLLDSSPLAVAEYNALADEFDLPRCQKLTDTRKAKLHQRLKDCGGIEGWNYAMGKIRGSPFLIGDNPRGWKADFDFILQEKSFTRLMEGFYDAKPTHNTDPFQQSLAELRAAGYE